MSTAPTIGYAEMRVTTRPSARAALDKGMAPGSIAVVGASSNPLKLGHMLLKTLINAGYEGKVYPINPSAESILGVRSYARLADVPGFVDVAVVIVPANQLLATLAECSAKGVVLVEAITSGFAEAGAEGR